MHACTAICVYIDACNYYYAMFVCVYVSLSQSESARSRSHSLGNGVFGVLMLHESSSGKLLVCPGMLSAAVTRLRAQVFL